MKTSEREKELKNFANNILLIRKYYGLSKMKMAQLLKIGTGNLNKLEKGIIPPRLTVKVIFNLYKNFRIVPKNLFGKKISDNTFKS